MSTIRDELFNAIYGQESSHGKVDTTKVNPQGVTGPMQVQDKTFALLKAKRLIPGHYEHRNPEHNLHAGRVLINHLADRYNDDPRKVIAAYYGGEKAVLPDGTLAKWGNKSRPNDPTVPEYVDQVMARMGQPVEKAPVPPAPEPDNTPYLKMAMPGSAEGPAPAPKEMPSKGSVPLQGRLSPTPDGILPVAAAVSAEARKTAQEVQDSTWLDRSRAAFPDQPLGAIGRYIIDQVIQDEAPADPGYVLDPRMLEGRSEDEISELLDSRSKTQEARFIADQDLRRERQAEAGKAGAGHALLANLIAGAPEGAITGLLAFRSAVLAGVSSAKYASQGRAGAAIAANFGENVVANVGLTAVQQAIDGYVGPADYAMGVAFSGIGSAAATPSIYGHSLRARSEQLAQAAAKEIEDKAVAAAAKLGPDATPAQIAAEIRRQEQEAVSVAKAEVDAPALSGDRKLFEVDDDGNLALPKAEGSQSAPPTTGLRERGPADAADAGLISPKVQHSWAGLSDNARKQTLIDRASPNRVYVNDVLQEFGGVDGTLKAAPGVHAGAGIDADLVKIAEWVTKNFLDGDRVFLLHKDMANPRFKGNNGNWDGMHLSLVKGRAIFLDPNLDKPRMVHTLVHELGHGVFAKHFGNAPDNIKQAIFKFQKAWQDRYVSGETRPGRTLPGHVPRRVDAALDRSLPSQVGSDTMRLIAGEKSASLFDILVRRITESGKLLLPDAGSSAYAKNYYPNLDEMSAEQFVKWMERVVSDEVGWKPQDIPEGLISWVKEIWQKFVHLFKWAKEGGYLNADESFQDFFEYARKTTAGEPLDAPGPEVAVGGSASTAPATASPDPFGLELLPEGTPQLAAEKAAIKRLYEKAADPTAPWNNIDPKFLSSLTDNSVFNVASTSLRMLKSDNPVVRMIAAELLESPSGAAGRRTTAAIKKHMEERRFMGNVINEVQDAYRVWRNEKGGNLWKDVADGELWDKFNREVALRIESGEPAHPAVEAAAKSLEGAYERMRISQKGHKTLGWAGLPETSAGYMPHRMSAERVRQMTPEQTKALHTMLSKQFQTFEGWDAAFSNELASKYIERARGRAVGEYETPSNLHQPGAASAVEDAIRSMGLPEDQVAAHLERYSKGAAGHTKRRIQLDMTADLGDGVRLLDLFETDQLKLVRGQAQRVSGEVALARHGIMGKPGLKLLRRAAGLGGDGTKAQGPELEALDQVAAEFLGEPFGDHTGKWLDRAAQVNSLARLGGMGFTQFAEFINGIAHIGAYRTMAAVGGIRRLRDEIIRLSKGEKVDNPLLNSLESLGGAEFGTDSYKLVFPFDAPDVQYQLFGRDTTTMADRLLRGGLQVQGKLSFWRAIHSAQQRGMAEQIVRKAGRFIREGGTDTALADMGIGADLVDRLKAEFANPDVARFNASGELEFLDITKVKDLKAAEEFIQAVHRGSAQIIQGTYIGETGKWAHSSMLRLITQFRTFSITSVEKQWTRQKATRGTAAALGLLMGSMTFAAPIYMIRTYLNSIGREDQDEYLEKQLDPLRVARATMNYVALTGLSGDFLDAASSVTGIGQVTGGRVGSGSEFVGNIVAPAAGLVDDIWKGLQDTKEGVDPHDLLKSMPFGRLPYLVPAVNSLGD